MITLSTVERISKGNRMDKENNQLHEKKSILKNPYFQNGVAFGLVEILLLSFFAGLNVGIETSENIYNYSVATGYITTD